jgi:CelD/BcsL family acetyltransferase involved in cellulose biosynthesis
MFGDGAKDAIAPARGRGGPARATVVGAAELPSLEAEWGALAARASEPNAFYAPALLIPALEAFSGDRPEIVVVRDGDGALIGLAPIAPLRGYSRLPVPYVATWMHKHCFFAAPLVRAGDERGFFRAFFDWAGRRGAFLRLRHLDAEGPLYAAAAAVAAETGRLVSPSARYERAMLTAPWTTEDYLKDSLRGKHRKDLRRRRARLEEAGTVRFEIFGDGDDLAAWTEDFLAVEAAGWKGAGGLRAHDRVAKEARRGLFLTKRRAAGTLQFFRFRLGDHTLAAAVNFRAGAVSYAFKIAYDEAYARYSPGVMIEIEIMKALEADRSISRIDSCAKVEHPMINRLWRERRQIAALNVSRSDAPSKALFQLLMMLERASEKTRARRENPTQEEGDDDL